MQPFLIKNRSYTTLTDKWMSCENNMTATSQSVCQRGRLINERHDLQHSRSLCALCSLQLPLWVSQGTNKKKKIVGSELDKKDFQNDFVQTDGLSHLSLSVNAE